jgi:hypothetical protein
MSNTKFDLVGITTNSLRSRANPSQTRKARMPMNTRTRPWKLDYFNLLAVPSVAILIVSCVQPSESKSKSVSQPLMRAELEPPKKTKMKKGQPPARKPALIQRLGQSALL